MNDVIKIHPEIEFTARCPVDRAKLTAKWIVIPGMRILVDATCPRCGARYYADLPVSHALWNASTFNRDTLEQYNSREENWFSEHLRSSFRDCDGSTIVPVVHKFFHAERIAVLNCLDFLYGHSLLKLLNAQRHLDAADRLGLCVLVPAQLVHLVPQGVAEIWEFPLPLKASWKWFPSLARWVAETIAERKECFLSRAFSHPSNRTFDLARFVRDLPDVSALIGEHQPVILFSYREDRLWGASLEEQEANLNELCAQLSAAVPHMAFVLVGFGRRNQVRVANANVVDLRATEFNVETDRLWLAAMQRADCSIGVLGSNMLLPSGLSKATVDLVPRHRSYNLFQDILFTETGADVRTSFLRYRFLYGNETLSDLRAAHVTDTVTSILAHNERSAYWFSFGESECGDFEPANGEIANQARLYRRALKQNHVDVK